MKKTIITASMFLAIFCCKAQQNQDEAMKAWQAYMTPGEPHKMLAKSSGTWNEDVTMWMAPGAPPEKSKSTAENKMIMNGLYQQSMHKGTMMGQPFEGMSTVGYDNAKKMYVSTWIDNMGSGIMYMEGTWDAGAKMIHFRGKGFDPVSGRDTMCRKELTFIDDNTQKMEMYMTMSGGQEMKTLEMIMKREMKKK